MACQVKENITDGSADRNPPRVSKVMTGYDCEFVVPPPKQFQSECPICLQVLREPHLISCCGYNFCAACIGIVGKDGKPCPLCKSPAFTTMANKGLKRTLLEFRVICPHRLRGCEWEDELEKLDKHVNCDPRLECRMEGCHFAMIECLYCRESIRRDKLTCHQQEHCLKRPFDCEFCKDYRSTYEDVTNSHWAECRYFLIQCPNDCAPSGPGIERQNLDRHVKEECPLTVVQCELHHGDHTVTLPRKDMGDHMKEASIAHISFLAAENHRLSERLLEKEEHIAVLIRQNRDLEETTTKKLFELKEETTSLLREVTKVDRRQTSNTQELRNYVELRNIVPVTMKMANFEELKELSQPWLSFPFYSAEGGYKMCLEVHANGVRQGSGTHVSVNVCFMRGEFDSHLKWPFRGKVAFQLLDQSEDAQHHTHTNHYYDRTPDRFAKIVDGEFSTGLGSPRFVPHDDLVSLNFLKDDCLLFQITKVDV